MSDLLTPPPLPQVPPLPPGLEAELRSLTPVAPRRPWRQLGLVLVLSSAWAMGVVGLVTVRRDFHELPRAWMVAYLTAWLLAFVPPTWLIVVPRRGDLMPRWRIAAALTAFGAIAMVVVGLTFARSGPHSLHRGLSAWAGCLSVGLATALVPIGLVALVVRGTAAHAPRITAAAIGCAAGGLGGFVLHLHCRISDGVHVGMVHGGVAIIAAAIAAGVVPRWIAAR